MIEALEFKRTEDQIPWQLCRKIHGDAGHMFGRVLDHAHWLAAFAEHWVKHIGIPIYFTARRKMRQDQKIR